MRTMNSISTHTYTMNRMVRSITRSTVRERTVRERTARRVRLHYHALFCHLTSSCGGSRKRASQPSSTSGVLPAFLTLLAPPPPIENEIEWIFPDLAIMQGSGAAAALTKYIRDALRLLPQFANSHLIQQFSGKSLRRGKCSCNVSFLTI